MRERLKKTMPSKAHHEILTAVGSICTQNLLLPIALVITVVGAVVTALVPPLILEKIRQEKPDIIGFQEVLPHVAAWLKENLTEYYIAGCGREKDLTGEKLVSTVSSLLAEPGKLAAMGKNARTLSVDDSLDRIADALMKLVKTP